MTNPAVTPEVSIAPELIPPLDSSLFRPTEPELEFLKAAISPDESEVRRRVEEVQKEAYAKHPYPCIRAYHHVSLMMSANKVYPHILEAGKNPETILLDLGCCMGTDVRKLVYDGFLASQVVGCDLRPEFIAAGHKLYSDAANSSIHFFAGDMFAHPLPALPRAGVQPSTTPLSEVSSLVELTGRVTHIYTGALFHLWDESSQLALALRLACLLRRIPGATIFGRHQALEQAGMIDDHMERRRYGHSPASWGLLWRKVFKEVDGDQFNEDSVIVEAELSDALNRPDLFPRNNNPLMMYWSVRLT
ncbi:hypothetical protein DENSPDRAFT_838894 [Dentipellis sp. KUC8613]|nr:hypothetical protein DENSPDRAFT_838894 [Dentipellis sp. KUC8613]